MMRRCLLFLISFPGIAAAADRPNVLFIAVDDLRCELGCYGVKEVISPNLDRLAASGVAFSRAYCQQAVCNPSRVSVMTGLRPDTTKVWDLVTEFRTAIPDAVTIPQHFRKHGYRALGYGKIFHNPFPDNESWDEPHEWPEAKLWSEEAQTQLAAFRNQMQADGKSDALIERMRALGVEKVDYPEEEHTDVAIAQQAIDAMRALAEKEQPFFLAAGFVRPHLPFVVPRKYWDLHDPTKIPLADNAFLPRGAPAVSFGEKSMGGLYELRDYMDFSGAPSPFEGSLSEAEQRVLKHGYYASVSFIDAQIGRLLDELDNLGLADNTIVLLWSDHGWKLGEHNGWCKQTNYEIDTRAPLMIRAPGMKANGTSSSALTEFVDIYPTLCELASLPIPDALEGTSLLPILKAESPGVKDAAFSQFPRTHGGREFMGCAIRTDRYRYVEWRDLNTGSIEERELYDHEVDPQENESVATERPDVVASLSERLARRFDPADWKPVKTSSNAARPTLTLVNQGRQVLDISWLPDKGEPRKSGRVQPGQSHVIKTTLGHRFLIEGTENGFREIITVTTPKRRHVIQGSSSPTSQTKSRETREIRGWKVHIHREMIENERKVIEHALKLLTQQLEEIIRVVPAKAVAELRKVPLYFSPPYEGGREGAEFHPDAGWLKKNGRDPGMAKAVEFTNARIFEEEMSRMPNVTLHELAHAYHNRVVRMGFSNLEVKRAYERAKSSGTYDRVERRRGSGKPNTFEKAYAMTTPQEYFAETTEAYFSGNDFFPFNREELQKHDPEMFALLEKLWQTNPN